MTNEELDAATKGWRTHPDPQHEETFADTERKLREIITTLRAQLARREDMHDCAMQERDDATLYADEQKARADRAEAALSIANATLAAQIEVDAEYIAFVLWKAEADRAAPNVGRNRTPEMFAEELETTRQKWFILSSAAIKAIRNQPHDRTALNRIIAQTREKALRDAAAVCLAVSVDPLTQAGREHAPWMKATAEDCSRAILALIEAPNAR